MKDIVVITWQHVPSSKIFADWIILAYNEGCDGYSEKSVRAANDMLICNENRSSS